MTEKNIKCWLWLQMCLGEGAKFKPIIDEFGSVEKLYDATIFDWKISQSLISAQVEKLQKFSIDNTQKIIDDCNRNNWQIITFDDERYPNRLREIDNPPAVLYVDGIMADFDNYVTIGIVGTRKASTYASDVAHVMAKGISMCGALVVSGGALGVDSSAHNGAMSANKPTYAVLGSGLGSNYLEANRELREQIVHTGGALITEYPPFKPVTKISFPMRNRIISGLSNGVFVVEAASKSGSLITANYACEQNRDIYAVPASIFDSHFLGTNNLIDSGATVVTSPRILIERYAEQYDTLDMSKAKTVRELIEELCVQDANAENQQQVTFDNIKKDRAQAVKRQNATIELQGDAKIVYASLGRNFESIDIIAQRANLDTKKVLVSLTMLEMKGLVESASGKRYKQK